MLLGPKPEGNICWETSQWGCAAMILLPCNPSSAFSTNLICNMPWYKMISENVIPYTIFICGMFLRWPLKNGQYLIWLEAY